VVDDCIELACPFSGGPTAFALILPGGRERYACCAVDALGIIAASRWRSRPPRRGRAWRAKASWCESPGGTRRPAYRRVPLSDPQLFPSEEHRSAWYGKHTGI
jgi:hypothetical protein